MKLFSKINYKKLLILNISGVGRWYDKKEMLIPGYIIGGHGYINTIEFLGNEKYTIRGRLAREETSYVAHMYKNHKCYNTYWFDDKTNIISRWFCGHYCFKYYWGNNF